MSENFRPMIGSGTNGNFADLPDWEFAMPGPLRERLNGLALAGAKTGTFSLAVLNEIYPEDLVRPGTQLVMRGTNGTRLAVVESVSTMELPIGQVTWEQVESEGESFRSVDHWRVGHEHFWSQFLAEIRSHTQNPGWEIRADTIVTYETFRIVTKLSDADMARFPMVELVVSPEDIEWVSSELFELGTTGIEEIPLSALTTSPRSESPPAALGLRAGFPSDEIAVAAEAALDWKWQPRFEVLLGDDWLDAWREHFEPTQIDRFLLLPAWWSDTDLAAYENPVTAGNPSEPIKLLIDPGRSFGTGAHATTALSLKALETNVQPASTVLDVGCGSGVLSVAAALLGAARVLGTDIESAAIDNSRRNAQRNHVTNTVTFTSDSVDKIDETFDLVVANILAPVLIALAEQISQRVVGGGHLILAGLIESQVREVLRAYESRRLTLISSSKEGNWVCLTLRRSPTLVRPKSST
jgi:ribosomal protein L11 methyltransferase